MSDTSAGHPNKPGRYEIRIKGHLGSCWATWFDGMTLTTKSDGTTVIEAPSWTRPRCTDCCTSCATPACRCSRSPKSNPDPQAPPATPHATPQGD